MHAAIQFHHEYPEFSKQWFNISEIVALLSVENEKTLHDLTLKFKENNLEHSAFFEPDIGNQLTAVTVEPTDKARKLCSNLPLALKEINK